MTEFENNLENEKLMSTSIETEHNSDNIPTGVSIESASYIEKNNMKMKSILLLMKIMKKNIHQNYFLKSKAINQKNII